MFDNLNGQNIEENQEKQENKDLNSILSASIEIRKVFNGMEK